MSATREAIAQVEKEACLCVQCGDCGGSGHYYVDMRGHYLGQHRGDDLDEMETCDTCGGSGISESCDRCQLLRDLDYDLENE